MEDDKLLKLSLITAIIGIFALSIVFYFADFPEHSFEEIKELDDYEEFYTTAKILDYHETDKVIMLDLVQYKEIEMKAVYFKDEDSNISLIDPVMGFVRIKGSKYDDEIIVHEFLDPNQ